MQHVSLSFENNATLWQLTGREQQLLAIDSTLCPVDRNSRVSRKFSNQWISWEYTGRFWEVKVIRLGKAANTYNGPKLSRQNQNCHGKTKSFTAKANTSQQKQLLHGKSKYLTAKPNTSRQRKYFTAKVNTSQQKQILHSKVKNSWEKQIHVTDLGGWKPGTQVSRKECWARGQIQHGGIRWVKDVLLKLWYRNCAFSELLCHLRSRWLVVDIYWGCEAARYISTTSHRHWGE